MKIFKKRVLGLQKKIIQINLLVFMAFFALASLFGFSLSNAASAQERLGLLENAALKDLDRGHRILLERGLQLQALVLDHTSFDPLRWHQSNFTTANFWARDLAPKFLYPAPGISNWARWTDSGSGIGELNFLTSKELPYLDTLISLQVGDEQHLTNPQNVANIAAIIAQHKVLYPNVLSFTNQYGNQEEVSTIQNFMSIAQPDILSMDDYPFKDIYEWYENGIEGGSPTDLYRSLEKYRKLGLAGNDGTGTTPIPTAAYIQTFHGLSHWDRRVTTSEVTLNQFAAWAFGYKMSTAFIYNVASNEYGPPVNWYPGMFSSGGVENPTVLFDHIANMNAQSRRLGPSLLRLISTEVFMERGRHEIGWFDVKNTRPPGVPNWNSEADPGYCTFLASANPNHTINGGLRGDVILAYFKVLHENFDGPDANNEIYFMVVNGLSDRRASSEETWQHIRLDFDFGNSGINSLQRLNKNTGKVEIVPLAHQGGTKYRIDFILNGGEGDLFKYNTGAPFVGVDSDNDLILNFGSSGLWAWMNNKTWANIHNLSPKSMIIGDLDNSKKDDFIASVEGNGTWKLMDNKTWEFLHKVLAKHLITGNLDAVLGIDLVVDFGNQYGLWILYNNKTWKQIHKLSATYITTAQLDANVSNELIVDFGSEHGIWVLWNDTNWTQLHTLPSQGILKANIDGARHDNLVINFGSGHGIWMLSGSQWSKLHTLSAKHMVSGDLDGNGKDDIVIDFGTPHGIWIWMNNSNWVTLHSLSVEKMAIADLDSNGKDEVILSHVKHGTWIRWNNSSWSKLHNWIAEDMAVGNLDGIFAQ